MSSTYNPYTEPYRGSNPSPETKGESETASDARSKVSDALHSGADKAREWSQRDPDSVASRPLRSAGDTLDSAADYLGDHAVADMYDDVVHWARLNPGMAIATAAAAGFCLGMFLYTSAPRRAARRRNG